MIDFLKKYKTQIFNIITIFLILEFVIYPGLTKADTVSNIMAGIGLLLLIIWGGLELYRYVTSDKGGIVDKAELDEAQKMSDAKTKEMLESELGPVIDKMAKEVLAKPKKKSVVKIDVTNAKNMNEVAGIVNPIAEGRVKISVENPKSKAKAQPKKEKVMGEYQLNNKEKVRKSLYKPKTK